MIEKPMAASLADADRMLAAQAQHDGDGDQLADRVGCIASNSQANGRRGCIGQVIEVHHYGGNRGPLWHTAGNVKYLLRK
ncbi:MAG: hypothetical protein R3C56_29085 [Pirellulaceae bacterium]